MGGGNEQRESKYGRGYEIGEGHDGVDPDTKQGMYRSGAIGNVARAACKPRREITREDTEGSSELSPFM